MRELTSTSYAVLGLLCLRPWTAYELAQQVGRGWKNTWPRARSGIYEEPKKLVEHGLARAVTQPRGKATKTEYSATASGRRAMRAWLAQPSAEPRIESEALVRVLFADQGGRDELLSTLGQFRQQAERNRDEAVAQAEEYLSTGGPFPDRLHLMVLLGKFINEYTDLLVRWSAWAEEEVAGWSDTTSAAMPDARDKLRDILTVHDHPTP